MTSLTRYVFCAFKSKEYIQFNILLTDKQRTTLNWLAERLAYHINLHHPTDKNMISVMILHTILRVLGSTFSCCWNLRGEPGWQASSNKPFVLRSSVGPVHFDSGENENRKAATKLLSVDSFIPVASTIAFSLWTRPLHPKHWWSKSHVSSDFIQQMSTPLGKSLRYRTISEILSVPTAMSLMFCVYCRVVF